MRRGLGIQSVQRMPRRSAVPNLQKQRSFLVDAPDDANREASKYRAISSVWEGSDAELLEAMFTFYSTIKPEPILDATYNAGRFWKGSTRDVWSMDIDPRYKPMIVGDNRIMKGVPSAKFGTVVFDQPHVGPHGRGKSVQRLDVDFGA